MDLESLSSLGAIQKIESEKKADILREKVLERQQEQRRKAEKRMHQSEAICLTKMRKEAAQWY